MNMPINSDGTVTFHATLLALIRTSLDVYIRGNMFENDQELKRVIQTIWPKTSLKNIEKLLPKYKQGIVIVFLFMIQYFQFHLIQNPLKKDRFLLR